MFGVTGSNLVYGLFVMVLTLIMSINVRESTIEKFEENLNFLSSRGTLYKLYCCKESDREEESRSVLAPNLYEEQLLTCMKNKCSWKEFAKQ
jgi:hypothetical protein